MRNNKSQYSDKVWVEIIRDHLINLFFIDGNLNSEMYETILMKLFLLFEISFPTILIACDSSKIELQRISD